MINFQSQLLIMSASYLVLNLFVSSYKYFPDIVHSIVSTIDFNFPILSVFLFPFNFPTAV